DVGQEVHLNADDAVALAVLAAAALDVEAEPSRLIPPGPRLGRAAEEVADGREQARVGGGVRPRRAADGRLVDVDDLVDVLEALDGIVLAGPLTGRVVQGSH